MEADLGTDPKMLANILTRYLNPNLKSVTADSREVKPGAAFVAVRGGREDGHRYLAQAAQSGAALLVGEEPPPAELKGAAYVRVPDSRAALAYLSAQLNGNPSHALTMVGVTGTSGKTTTTYMIESVLRASGHRVGVIGTVNFRFGDKIYPSTHTTPGAPELQALLAEMQKDGCTAVVMEVSSHALKQSRVACIAFDAVVFTNLTPEHLDFHPDLEDYYRSKAILFKDCLIYSIRSGKRPFAAICIDDEWGRRLLDELRNPKPLPEMWFASFGLDAQADVSTRNLKIAATGIAGEAGGVKVRSPLVGRFNAQNLLGAILASQGLHINPLAIADGIMALKQVPGRLERIPSRNGVNVFVDYAHKPDALDKALRVLRELSRPGKLITVIGCGGDRDRIKRSAMGGIAAQLSDHVVVTSDNPRTEDPTAIINQIVSGISDQSQLTVEADRRKAIFAAIARAQAGDWVMIAGKGHEDYQVVADPSKPGGTIKVHFDDREVAAEALSTRT